MDMDLSLQSPGKIILLGEHAVLYGSPGIALPLPHALQAIAKRNQNKNIRLFPAISDSRMERALRWIVQNLGGGFDFFWKNRVPIGAGLGSSAAFSNLLIRWALKLNHLENTSSIEIIHAAVHELENIFHGSASGIDDAVVCFNQPVLFQKPHVKLRWPFFYEPIRDNLWRIQFPAMGLLVVGDSHSWASTQEMVKKVRHNDDGTLADQTTLLVEKAVIALETGQLEMLGNVLDAAHDLLRFVGASTPDLDALVQRAKSAGALGAKLTGAGGGGCVLALASDNTSAQAIAHAWQQTGFQVIATLPLSTFPPY